MVTFYLVLTVYLTRNIRDDVSLNPTHPEVGICLRSYLYQPELLVTGGEGRSHYILSKKGNREDLRVSGGRSSHHHLLLQ